MSKRFGKSRSRHIPKAVRDTVAKASGFVRAWDGVPLTEYHHIHEFSEGGPSTAENLILLCPTCHASYHAGTISREELLLRRSDPDGDTAKGSGTIHVPRRGLTLRLGGSEFRNCVIPIQTEDDPPPITLKVVESCLLVSLRYFDSRGKLVAWVGDNRWWVDLAAGFSFEFTPRGLRVIGPGGRSVLELAVGEKTLNLTGELWLHGEKFEFTSNRIINPQGGIMQNLNLDVNHLPVPAIHFVTPNYLTKPGIEAGMFLWPCLRSSSSSG